ncbi:hypothetical protein AK830_g2320 [Neonectria ditissima]|uniref:PNPLA domain-containing protein n=1 Tax=Neonectria ditissima TaxID=78410 RepID=A0A0P7BFD8_9HYPO|nr:hypothetical protein AK830_g2320 [Neonectria ditissima]
MPYVPATTHPNGVRLLALDGGGVRGVVSLIILDEIMKRIQKRKGLKEPCRPADYFELAAGTSTGGIIGIMLFRLHMTAEDTIKMYDVISKQVFSPKVYGYEISNFFGNKIGSLINNSKTIVQSSRFDDASLKLAIDNVVEKFGLDDNDKKLKGEAPLFHEKASKMFLCTTAQNKAETVLMRSYELKNKEKAIAFTSSKVNNVMQNYQSKITISLAARATSAAPTYFPEVEWPSKADRKADETPLIFWDGGLLNNNPIDQLWYSRYDLVASDEPAPPVSCVISLGTGFSRSGSPDNSWIRLAGVASSVMDFATNTNAKGKDFSRHMKHLNTRPEYEKTEYLRFNPDLGANAVGLADYTKMEFLKKITREDLARPGSQDYIERAVRALAP